MQLLTELEGYSQAKEKQENTLTLNPSVVTMINVSVLGKNEGNQITSGFT